MCYHLFFHHFVLAFLLYHFPNTLICCSPLYTDFSWMPFYDHHFMHTQRQKNGYYHLSLSSFLLYYTFSFVFSFWLLDTVVRLFSRQYSSPSAFILYPSSPYFSLKNKLKTTFNSLLMYTGESVNISRRLHSWGSAKLVLLCGACKA